MGWDGVYDTLFRRATALVKFVCMLVVAYFLDQTANNRVDEVAAIADDLEVKKADDEAAYLNKCYREVTTWHDVPFTPKLLLQTSVACIVTSCYIFQLFSSLCFTEHTLTDSIDDNLQGNVGNLFLPLGWVATGLFIASVYIATVLYFFISWGKRHARHLVNATAPKPEEEAGYGSTNHLTDIDLHSAEIEDSHADELVQSKNDNSATYSTNHHSGFQRAPSLSSKF